MPDSLEVFINEQRAEVAFVKIIMQVVMVRLIASDPATAEERLLDLKTTVMAAVNRMPANPSDQGEVRWKHLVAMRGEQFFGDMEAVIHQARTKTGDAGRN